MTGVLRNLPPRSFTRQPKPERKPMAFTPLAKPANVQRCDMGSVAQPKENPLRSEPYRRLIAAMPCAWCGIEGYSQAAHPPPTGKGIKEDDRLCFALCCTRPGVLGCHASFDQYRLIAANEMRQFAHGKAEIARQTIIENGDWPKGLPLWVET